MCRPPDLQITPVVTPIVEKKQEYVYNKPQNKEVERPDIYAQMFVIQQYKRERDTIHQELLEVKKELSASLSREKAMNDKMDIIMLVLHKQRHKRIAEKGHPHITTL
jgi:hypothetical protein